MQNLTSRMLFECPECKSECRYLDWMKLVNNEISRTDGKEVVFYDRYQCINGDCQYIVCKRIG